MPAKTLTLFDLVPGRILGERFRIESTSRRDGMSTAFLVEDQREKAQRELKLFPAALFEGADQGRDFARQMQAWTKVGARAVVRVHEVDAADDGTILIVTDVPPQRSLRDELKEKGPASPAEVRRIGLELLDGLAAIHAAALVHGDIKPLTVRLHAGDGHVALIDGGITAALWTAKHLGDKTALIGTPFYAPVEQFGGESPDVQSDVYNAACVLYELATGKLPWKGKTFLEVFQEKLQKRPPSMRQRAPEHEVPEALERAILLGLMADRRERHPSAIAFREALSAAG
jgi:serine/threonine-protein kinase